VIENKIPRGIMGERGWRQQEDGENSLIKELHNFSPSPNIRVIKAKRM